MDTIEFGDCREIMHNWSAQGVRVNTCVTSPPYYGLRDYGHDKQIGLEQTPKEYISAMVEVFRYVRDILKDNGTLWLNLGDSYAGSGKGQWNGGSQDPKNKKTQGMPLDTVRPKDMGLKAKDLMGIPWRVALALQDDGWYLRQDIIWHKPSPMPESVKDRCTKAHEYIFLFSKSLKYYFDSDAIQEPAVGAAPGNITHKGKTAYENGDDKMRTKSGLTNIGARETRNKRSVWTVPTKPYKGAHFAVFPPDLIEPCVLAGSPLGGVVLDPFMGSGTTAYVAKKHGRKYLGCELNYDYKKLQDNRLQQGFLA